MCLTQSSAIVPASDSPWPLFLPDTPPGHSWALNSSRPFFLPDASLGPSSCPYAPVGHCSRLMQSSAGVPAWYTPGPLSLPDTPLVHCSCLKPSSAIVPAWYTSRPFFLPHTVPGHFYAACMKEESPFFSCLTQLQPQTKRDKTHAHSTRLSAHPANWGHTSIFFLSVCTWKKKATAAWKKKRKEAFRSSQNGHSLS